MTRPRPCSCDRTSTCRLCWLWHNDARYNRLWGGDGTVNKRSSPWHGDKPAGRQLPARKPCAHLGSPTGETRPCKQCNKTVQVPLMGCAVHGTCSVAKLLAGTECCRICPDYREAT